MFHTNIESKPLLLNISLLSFIIDVRPLSMLWLALLKTSQSLQSQGTHKKGTRMGLATVLICHTYVMLGTLEENHVTKYILSQIYDKQYSQFGWLSANQKISVSGVPAICATQFVEGIK